MEKIDKILLIISPIIGLIGTLMIRYSEKNKIKTDPKVTLYKYAAELTKNVPIDSIMRHDKLYYPHNRKMKILLIIGIVLLFISAAFAVYAVI
jgi:hypothetical protein